MRIGIVGCGAIAPVHIEYANACHEVVALCDCEVERAAALRAQFGLQCPIYSDYTKMLDEGGVAAVHLCTPHDLHATQAVAALKRGIHVLCEKPACICLEELELLQKAVGESKARYGVCFQNRYNESTLLAKKYLAAHPPVGGEGRVFWKREGEYYTASTWRGKKAREGGSVLINQAVHTLDLLCELVGAPNFVTAVTANFTHAAYTDTEDLVAAFYEGEKGNFQLYATTSAERDALPELRIFTETGRVELSGNTLFINEEGGQVCDETPSVGKWVWGNSHKTLFADYYAAIKEERPFAVDFASVERVHRAVFATYQSAGKKIKIIE